MRALTQKEYDSFDSQMQKQYDSIMALKSKATKSSWTIIREATGEEMLTQTIDAHMAGLTNCWIGNDLDEPTPLWITYLCPKCHTKITTLWVSPDTDMIIPCAECDKPVILQPDKKRYAPFVGHQLPGWRR